MWWGKWNSMQDNSRSPWSWMSTAMRATTAPPGATLVQGGLEIHWALTMAGAYASHGETYVNPGNLLWWSVGGELVGEEPARLGFLKQIMMAAPFTEMEPAPDVIKNGDGTATALAKRGSYYIFHFVQQKQAPDWNIGFFGPTTPSKPLPMPPLDLGKFKAPAIPEFMLCEGNFRVDLIDTWNMKIYPLGFTDRTNTKVSSLPEHWGR